ncbi:NUC169 domain-containing protein [Polychytrium aggregatum]|uniref:NUC169 domain-containing protein n=1 Tax=Polychytrium aggregatum TaxID=110093 RepID=UPI0022FDC391|nr:NUC169 domain-containing protein [Polychytrium aggregatum]KAI9209593.1 NUC169 domain-containing protein [Polychytrium aggregatum]
MAPKRPSSALVEAKKPAAATKPRSKAPAPPPKEYTFDVAEDDSHDEDEDEGEDAEEDDQEYDEIPEINEDDDDDDDNDEDDDDEEDEDYEGADDDDDAEDDVEDGDEDEDDDDELQSSDDDGDDDESGTLVGSVRSRDSAKPRRPEIDPVYNSDTSDEETENTIGNVPIEWYEDYDHIGYDIHGQKIARPQQGDELDSFLAKMDDPNLWRSVYDKVQQKNIVLSSKELEMIKRIQNRTFADSEYDPYEPTVEWFTSKTEIHPLSSAPEPKRRFIPSKWEAKRIMKIVRAIREGRVVVKKPEVVEPAFFDIWADNAEPSTPHPMHIPAPKVAPPHHMESYNPPAEYIPTPEEVKQWEALDREDRPQNFIPKKHSSLRQVAGYQRFIQERFERCLDLYLCPRMIKHKINIDPESLIPKLPSPKDLRPFPSSLAVVYRGHTDRVRNFSFDPTGQWIISGSDDQTAKIWEVSTGRCIKTFKFEGSVSWVSWNPNPSVSIVALVERNNVHVFNPDITGAEIRDATNRLLAQGWEKHDDSNQKQSDWIKVSRGLESGYIKIQLQKYATSVVWHRRGDYFSTVCPDAAHTAVLVHQLSTHQTQSPFKKSKGLVQRVLFHPSKPVLFVATQRNVRVYDLVKQELFKKLQAGVKWISSMDVHPSGDHVLIGSYDKRLCWFDMDLSAKPYKTLRYHKFALRHVTYHKRYPLFASCSDDGTVNVFHGTVYSDLMMNPLIVPLKTLKAHDITQNLGVLHCEFHPSQPWILSSGADHTLKLFS